MADIMELIEERLKELNLPPELKAKQKEVLVKVIVDGEPLMNALNVKPEEVEYIYAQAFKHYQAGQYKEARGLFFLLYELSPLDMRFAMGIAACYHMQKNYQQAMEWYMHCAITDQTDPMPFYYIYDCFIHQGERLSALVALRLMRKRIAEDDERYSVLLEKGNLLIESLTIELKDELRGHPDNKDDTKIS